MQGNLSQNNQQNNFRGARTRRGTRARRSGRRLGGRQDERAWLLRGYSLQLAPFRIRQNHKKGGIMESGGERKSKAAGGAQVTATASRNILKNRDSSYSMRDEHIRRVLIVFKKPTVSVSDTRSSARVSYHQVLPSQTSNDTLSPTASSVTPVYPLQRYFGLVFSLSFPPLFRPRAIQSSPRRPRPASSSWTTATTPMDPSRAHSRVLQSYLASRQPTSSIRSLQVPIGHHVL